jgi:hexosaminidase
MSAKALTVNSYAAGAQVVQWTYHGGTTQQWVQVPSGSAYKYRNVWSGLYLDVQGYSYAAGAPLVQWYSTNGLNQQFYLRAQS